MSINYSFSGKRVLITGGGQGIGRQLVQRFHDGGATVCTVDKNPDLVSKLKEELPSVHAEVVDVTDWKATNKVVQSFGPIDHLVNNAGSLTTQPFMEITEDVAKYHYDMHVVAAINITQTVAKGMIERGTGGSVVNIVTVDTRQTVPQVAAYAASKAALENLTKSMALELGPHNIRVNCILPGAVDTPFIPKILKECPDLEKLLGTLLNKLTVKRLIEPNEVADLVLFLLSPLASMVVGAEIVIDGGMLL